MSDSTQPNGASTLIAVNEAAHRAAEQAINANAKAIASPDVAAPAALRAVMTLVRRDDGKVLAIKMTINLGQTRWTLPGAIVRAGESIEDCQARGLRECLGAIMAGSADAPSRVKIYEGPNSIVYIASIRSEGERVLGRNYPTCAWLTDEQFLANSLQGRALFEAVFAAARTADVARSPVISKLKDGRILYAISHEVRVDGQWEIREPHHVHAMNAAAAKEQFLQTVGPNAPPVRIIAVAPAIGFFETDDGDLIG